MRNSTVEDRGRDDTMTPHAKPHMTSAFGRLVDRATYMDVLLLAIVVVVGTSVYFWLAPSSHGLCPRQNLLGSAYFALVTFTSLGYGELLPQGLGRLVAVFDVVSGLALTAVLIGKVASERQFSILMLLHTSDTQKRIAGFATELDVFRAGIEAAINAGEVETLRGTLDDHLRLTKAMKSYLVFNAHHAVVLEFGNFTALIGLYDEIRASFDLMSRAYRDPSLGDAVVMRRLRVCMTDLARVVARMKQLHRKGRARTPLWRSALEGVHLLKATAPSTPEQSAKNRLVAMEVSMARDLADAEKWEAEGFHSIQIERVFGAFPKAPRSGWPSGLHKTVARDLGISNSVAMKCVTDLLATGRLPKRPG